MQPDHVATYGMGGFLLRKVSNDHRTRVTKILLRKSFLELLHQKSIQNISIKELCENAGINRGTFYSHYTDLPDLLTHIENEIISDFERTLEPLSETDKPFNPVEISMEIFRCLKENADFCAVILHGNGDWGFANRLIRIGKERSLESYLSYFSNASRKQIELFYSFASAGCIGILRKWLDEGMVTPVEELGEAVQNMMMYGLGIFSKDIKIPETAVIELA